MDDVQSLCVPLMQARAVHVTVFVRGLGADSVGVLQRCSDHSGGAALLEQREAWSVTVISETSVW